MNKRIKELADEAKKFHHLSLAPTTHSLPVSKVKELANQASAAGIEIISDEFCEKFAEFIIQECVSLFDSSEEMKTVGFLSHKQIVDKIEEHFGVEK